MVIHEFWILHGKQHRNLPLLCLQNQPLVKEIRGKNQIDGSGLRHENIFAKKNIGFY
jgi:hypothetical protein